MFLLVSDTYQVQLQILEPRFFSGFLLLPISSLKPPSLSVATEVMLVYQTASLSLLGPHYMKEMPILCDFWTFLSDKCLGPLGDTLTTCGCPELKFLSPRDLLISSLTLFSLPCSELHPGACSVSLVHFLSLLPAASLGLSLR